MTEFPSVEWFNKAGELLNKSDSFKRLGTCDTQMGVAVGDRYFEVDFEAFEMTGAKVIDAARADELDFTLSQDYDAWKAMLKDIKSNGRATHEYTLNSLDLRSDAEFAKGKDYNRRDAFYRFNQTIQEYFDMSSKMDTTFSN
ncbi:MAG: hypothetical protein U0547_04465 [Dehalococcoidia bacterium]